MTPVLYITHPQVVMDRDVPVPQWGLSEIGRNRAEMAAGRIDFPAGTVFIASTETKALELAEILAQSCAGNIFHDGALGENDRTATGFLPPDEFEDVADRFFATPNESVKGWERAIDAQVRIVGAVTRLCTANAAAPALVFCGHGAVGTLLKCHAGNRPISRNEDQPDGGGNIFAFSLAPEKLICEWTPMENWMELKA